MKPTQRGASAVEFVVIFLLFLALLAGLFEMSRLYRAKHSLTTATFLAARAGALHHGRRSAIERELARAMAPAYLLGQRDAEGVALAVARASALIGLPGIGAEVLSPTREAFDQLARSQHIQLSDAEEFGWQRAIPNDNLRHRPRETASIQTERGLRQIHLQDANLLKIRSLWCHRLLVPGLDKLIFEIVNASLAPSERQAVCSAISQQVLPGVATGYYLAVSADAMVRMQTAILGDDLS